MTAAEVHALVERVHRRLLSGVAAEGTPRADAVRDAAREEVPLLSGGHLELVTQGVLDRVDGLGPLEPLVRDPAVSDVLVNGPGPVWVERGGVLERTAIELDGAEILRIIERIVSPLGRRVDRRSPIVDARLPDGSRVNAVVPPLAVNGPCLAIRRFDVVARELEALADPGVAELLAWAVTARQNLVVIGGTGAGKTTLLNALAGRLDPAERVILIEDVAELRFAHGHVVRLEARPANADGIGETTIRDLVRTALRLRPDRIVVGEVRGPEALDMLQAMNTGHDGALSTCHANSPTDALMRLETMVLSAAIGLPLAAVRQQLAGAVDLIVQIGRTAGGARRVLEVAEVVAGEGTVTARPLTRDGRLTGLPDRPPRARSVRLPDPTVASEVAT